MKKYIIASLISILGLLTWSCEDYLDTQIQQNFDEDLFLNSGFNNLKALGMGTYDYLKHFNGYGNQAMLAAGCDEADFAKPGAIQRFNTGAWDPFNNPDDVYSYYYKGIRHANLFLEKSIDFKEMIVADTVSNKKLYLDNVDDFTKLRAEVRFLRAYFYMELIKRYGGVPLVKKVITEEEASILTRATFDECADFIVSECDTVYPILTNHYTNYGRPENDAFGKGDVGSDNNRLGRIEKPAAVALKIRARLYAASTLHNPTKDMQKWEEVIKQAGQFFNDPNCSHVRYLYSNYSDLFQTQNTINTLIPFKGSFSGIIMTRPYEKNTNNFEKANYPIGMINGGGGVTCPSQNLVDAYEMKVTGKSISDPTSGYDPLNPYANRDPRFAFSIVYNGSIMGKNTDNTDRVTETFEGGADAIGAKFGATTTGYYLRKMNVENFNLAVGGGKSKSWVLMRYAEILLTYAEAANEIYGPDTRPTVDGIVLPFSAREALNEVRNRVNMPFISLGMSQDEFREKLRNERRVELAFEEQRFFDVRRWKIAETTENQPLMGMKISRSDNGTLSYQKFKVEDRVFKEAMYLYPIPYQELIKSKGLISQNPGW